MSTGGKVGGGGQAGGGKCATKPSHAWGSVVCGECGSVRWREGGGVEGAVRGRYCNGQVWWRQGM